MCGRYALHASPEVIALAFGLNEVPSLAPRYNIAPMSDVLIARAAREGAREAVRVRWGLLPHWARDAKLAAKLNNARAETIAEKPSFRDAFRRRRCLIPASGFYEWKGVAGRKLPWYITPGAGALFAFAGLWERWQGPDGPLETCAVITTDANAVMEPIHDRMPVILAPQDYARWLDHAASNDVRDLLRPCPPEAITAHRVGTAVNRAANEGEALIEPVDEP